MRDDPAGLSHGVMTRIATHPADANRHGTGGVGERRGFQKRDGQYAAAEVGRLIAKLSENCQTEIIANGKNDQNGNWVDELARTSNTPVKTIYNWWSSFTKSAGLSITPKQARNAKPLRRKWGGFVKSCGICQTKMICQI